MKEAERTTGNHSRRRNGLTVQLGGSGQICIDKSAFA